LAPAGPFDGPVPTPVFLVDDAGGAIGLSEPRGPASLFGLCDSGGDVPDWASRRAPRRSGPFQSEYEGASPRPGISRGESIPRGEARGDSGGTATESGLAHRGLTVTEVGFERNRRPWQPVRARTNPASRKRAEGPNPPAHGRPGSASTGLLKPDELPGTPLDRARRVRRALNRAAPVRLIAIGVGPVQVRPTTSLGTRPPATPLPPPEVGAPDHRAVSGGPTCPSRRVGGDVLRPPARTWHRRKSRRRRLAEELLGISIPEDKSPSVPPRDMGMRVTMGRPGGGRVPRRSARVSGAEPPRRGGGSDVHRKGRGPGATRVCRVRFPGGGDVGDDHAARPGAERGCAQAH